MKKPIRKTHKFILTVTTARSKKSAELAVLAAFAKRDPDQCEFHLSDNWKNDKRTWMAGSESGANVVLDIFSTVIGNIRNGKVPGSLW